MQDFRKLEVWRLAMELTEEVYRLTALLPSDERFGLCSQARRASISIPSNIAEGTARESSPELLRFLRIALGSLSELETQVELMRRLNLVEPSESLHFEKRARHLGIKLRNFAAKLQN
jgi:four helix bundle protein